MLFITITDGKRCQDDKLNIEGLRRYLLLRYGYTLTDTPTIDRKAKPYYIGLPYEVHFSVSHTKGNTLIAYYDKEIGIDIEYYRDIDYIRILDRFFLPEEVRNVHTVADFLEGYTKKEAYMKMLGKGIESFRKYSFLDGNVYFTRLDFLHGCIVNIAAREQILHEEIICCASLL